MNKRFALLLIAICTGLAATLLITNLARAGAPPASTTSAINSHDGAAPAAPQITSSLRISIPYGIAPVLPLINEGRNVVVSGHGGCPAGETVTIAISITQPLYSAAAAGETVQDCTGAEEQWQLVATVDTMTSLAAGPAEACGTATMRLGDLVMEVEPWCRPEPSMLVALDREVFLPHVTLGTAE